MTRISRDSMGTPHTTRAITLQTPSSRLPGRWRQRLPEPETYYRREVPSLGRTRDDGWAQGLCPFHDDHTPSLSVRLGGDRGGWVCFAGCGKGDLVGFHMRLKGLAFREAVRDLVEGAR